MIRDCIRMAPLAAALLLVGCATPYSPEEIGQQRLTQTLAKVPDNAGPLNTQRLMHQALSLMGDASPAYLQHFMAHVDALLTLEQLGPQPTPARKDGPRASRHS